MSSSPARWAEWAGHITEQIGRLHAILGDPVQLPRLDEGLNYEGAVRCLEIISEAAARLHRADIDLSGLEPDIPWSDIRAFGNIVRHDYPEVNDSIVRDTLLEGLDPLRAAALRLKARFEAEAS